MSYAFISHASACEALRISGLVGIPWPETTRMLPHRGGCVRLQREMANLAKSVNLKNLGIVSTPVDILVPSPSVRSRGKQARTHSWLTTIPAEAMRRVHENILVSTPEFIILQLAHRHVRRIPLYDKMIDQHLADKELLNHYGIDEDVLPEDLLSWEHIRHIVDVARIAMEFSGTYRLSTPVTATAYDQPRLMSIASARAFLDASSERNDAPRAKRALDFASDGSASPMETALFLMLTLPEEMGGYGLLKPVINKAVPVQLNGENLTPDLLWEENSLVIEYDSAEFHSEQGRDKTDQDIMRANALRAAGYQVLEATPGIVCDYVRMDLLASQIAQLLNRSIPDPDLVLKGLRRRLHGLLFLGIDSV